MKGMNMVRCFGWLFVLVVLAVPLHAGDVTYQLPPKLIADVTDAPATPSGFVNSQATVLLLATPVKYPPISDLAKPMLRLAGNRIDPTTNGPHTPTTWTNLVFRQIADKSEVPLRLPEDARPGGFSWNAAGTRVAFENTTDRGIELWIAEAATGQARRIPGVILNDILWGPFKWSSNPNQLLASAVPPDRGAPPAAPAAPTGPKVLDAAGVEKARSTYEARDVLKSEHDAKLFDYYTTSQLVIVDLDTDTVTPLGKPAIFNGASVSPDGKYILVSRLHRPYSYELTSSRFPEDTDVWTIAGDPVCNVARLPLADQVPIHGIRTGPRNVIWWPTEDATLTWSEALDGGDWKIKAPFRSKAMRFKAPFTDKPEELFKTELRLAGASAMQSGRQGWVWTYDEDRHWMQQFLADMDASPVGLRLLWEGSWDDAYGDPGDPDMTRLPNNKWVIREHEGAVHLIGSGGSPDGYRPFIDRMDLATGQKTRLFRCDKDHLEYFWDWVDIDRGIFLTRRQSPTEPPNFFLRTLSTKVKTSVPPGEEQVASTMKAVTDFGDPAPILRKVSKQLVTYKRPDGVELSFTLLLPPDYKKGTRYPTVLDAYPLDYTDKEMAGQVRDTSKTFTSVWGADVRLYALAGYVVLYNTAIPIVGPATSAYDTYTEQLVAGAKAAIDKAVELGVTDPDRVGVIGHSHGALMVANLLARSDLFKAGVARSGAYNKSLTAFGFQNERRTLWEGRETYIDVSPLFFADKIKEPLLLIHGELDQNPGTTPIQSERMYEAVRGAGGTARLVMLPFEGHGYESLESVRHVLYEMVRWFDMYVKKEG